MAYTTINLPAIKAISTWTCVTPVRVGLPEDLLADSATSDQALPVVNEALIAYAQGLLDQVKMDPNLNLNQGEVLMFIADVPNIPPQDVPVMIAQANQAQAGDVKTMRTIGVCHPAPNEDYSLENVVSPIVEAGSYLGNFEGKNVQHIGTITILQQPKHGILRLLTEADRGMLFCDTAAPVNPADGAYVYLPNKGYVGKNSATALVEIAGVKVKVVYFFQAWAGGLGNTRLEELCGKRGYHWKISSTLDSNGNSMLTAVDYQSNVTGENMVVTPAAAAITLDSLLGGLAANTSGISLNIADLPAGSVGQPTANTTTLDTDAAGYGWFVDSTPYDNDELRIVESIRR